MSESSSRRQFLATSCTAIGCAVAAQNCMMPPPANPNPRPTNLTVSQVAVDQLIPSSNTALAVFVGRDAGGFYAVSSSCTHEGTTIMTLAGMATARFECPNHQSRFTATGQVLNGPATIALPTYAVSFTGTGATATILVDTATRVASTVRATPPA